MIPEQFRAVACPEPTPEQYAAVKLEAGMRSGVKKFKRDQKAGKLSAMEDVAMEGFMKKSTHGKHGKGGLQTTSLPEMGETTDKLSLAAETSNVEGPANMLGEDWGEMKSAGI